MKASPKPLSPKVESTEVVYELPRLVSVAS